MFYIIFCLILLGLNSALSWNEGATICGSLIDKSDITFEEELQHITLATRGDSLVLKCSVFGAPQAAITWYHSGRKIAFHQAALIESSIPSRSIGSGVVESSYNIGCVDASTSGEYMCQASSPCGKSIISIGRVVLLPHKKGNKCNVTMTKKATPPYISLSTVTRLELTGNTVQLMCRAKGFPLPNIKWWRIDDDEILQSIDNDPSYMPLSNGDILVIGDNMMRTVSLRCMAENINGIDFSDSTVVFVDEN